MIVQRSDVHNVVESMLEAAIVPNYNLQHYAISGAREKGTDPFRAWGLYEPVHNYLLEKGAIEKVLQVNGTPTHWVRSSELEMTQECIGCFVDDIYKTL